MKPTILFVAHPDDRSQILHSKPFQDRFECLHHEVTTKESLYSFLKEHSKSHRIVAIYGGYPAFHPLGGLTREIIYNEWFPRETLQCLALCSRGYNGFDLEALRENGIMLFNFQDQICDTDSERDQGGNDVADCVLWHVLEGFRKFSFQQEILRADGDTYVARNHGAMKNDNSWEFGHRLSSDGSLLVRSPRGKKCLILGFGSVGQQIAYKLHHGLGMQIHYCRRTEPQIPDANGWIYHSFDDELKAQLRQFSVIVVALPGNSDTYHLIDKEFLSHCDGPNLTLINVGRGSIVNSDDIESALQRRQLRHFGADVFYREPKVDQLLLQEHKMVSITPHLGSSTEEVFYQSCELALRNIIECLDGSLSRVSQASRIV
ncbi:hypothetical protein HG536_0D02640 [Torulaspora globosa]|uniref:D-isomer specific 2-hydroxyacid dehydrogenase NAD-binding domain-containing protein n=1 Tax=Torulaspora globosa TaxID=48254 RepID=A0A7G3ZGV6_9SACH|nr:uncharacterized protein HG536_0D02640 [Torulaspora globosa]QLL32742.1 hypothetical protein HG536_0D02640 [Torulaspora globosa]